MVDVVRLAGAGDMERAQDIFDAYLPLVRYEQQPGLGLAVRKHTLHKRGAIASPQQRRPGAPLAPRAVSEVDRLIARQERKLKDIG
jgi:4-hydroxy-tetrahydrodipicolinate synthase